MFFYSSKNHYMQINIHVTLRGLSKFSVVKYATKCREHRTHHMQLIKTIA